MIKYDLNDGNDPDLHHNLSLVNYKDFLLRVGWPDHLQPLLAMAHVLLMAVKRLREFYPASN